MLISKHRAQRDMGGSYHQTLEQARWFIMRFQAYSRVHARVLELGIHLFKPMLQVNKCSSTGCRCRDKHLHHTRSYSLHFARQAMTPVPFCVLRCQRLAGLLRASKLLGEIDSMHVDSRLHEFRKIQSSNSWYTHHWSYHIYSNLASTQSRKHAQARDCDISRPPKRANLVGGRERFSRGIIIHCAVRDSAAPASHDQHARELGRLRTLINPPIQPAPQRAPSLHKKVCSKRHACRAYCCAPRLAADSENILRIMRSHL